MLTREIGSNAFRGRHALHCSRGPRLRRISMPGEH